MKILNLILIIILNSCIQVNNIDSYNNTTQKCRIIQVLTDTFKIDNINNYLVKIDNDTIILSTKKCKDIEMNQFYINISNGLFLNIKLEFLPDPNILNINSFSDSLNKWNSEEYFYYMDLTDKSLLIAFNVNREIFKKYRTLQEKAYFKYYKNEFLKTNNNIYLFYTSPDIICNCVKKQCVL